MVINHKKIHYRVGDSFFINDLGTAVKITIVGFQYKTQEPYSNYNTVNAIYTRTDNKEETILACSNQVAYKTIDDLILHRNCVPLHMWYNYKEEKMVNINKKAFERAALKANLNVKFEKRKCGSGDTSWEENHATFYAYQADLMYSRVAEIPIPGYLQIVFGRPTFYPYNKMPNNLYKSREAAMDVVRKNIKIVQ